GLEAEERCCGSRQAGRSLGGQIKLPYQIYVWKLLLLLFDVAVRGIHLGGRDVIPLVLLATALWLLLAVLGSGGRLNNPCEVRNMDRFYHTSLIGRPALEL